MMYRRSNLVEIKNCKVIPGDHAAPQHRLVVMDVNVGTPEEEMGIMRRRSGGQD